MSAKLLLVRTGSDVFFAQALVVANSGVYQRSLATEADLILAYQAEKFDLIVYDSRNKDSGGLDLVDKSTPNFRHSGQAKRRSGTHASGRLHTKAL